MQSVSTSRNIAGLENIPGLIDKMMFARCWLESVAMLPALSIGLSNKNDSFVVNQFKELRPYLNYNASHPFILVPTAWI
ncbi:hypothetical protein KDH_45470 [Dictyobacter sp. S3.2.2.5]|uniref:Uncharacterized protein n=1 Tax=Dictyobacter halimunensis TaxID=3026934 RepID=A0ABQ6FTX4_9CHLR|nr:hypothetical protein KDH_45470 [Dictyobacter sp. S3.2.2.5]